MSKPFSVAIDGPCGAGKSSVAKGVAKKLGADYLDTGAMYRAVGLYMLRNGVDANDVAAVDAHMPNVRVKVTHEGGVQRVFVNGEDVTDAIRTQAISDASSSVARVNGVRKLMVALQREIAAGRSVVMDGRDIGTHVLPNATLKIYLNATETERAMRRYLEMVQKGLNVQYETVLEDLVRRDENDMHREFSPLRKADDAIEIDSTEMDEDQVIDSIVTLLNERLH